MSKTSPTADPLSPERALPPVEPPSARFLVQLFVIPGLIVLAVTLVVFSINWLAHWSNTVDKNLAALKRPGTGRWQAAVNLAHALQTDASGELRGDRDLAGKLAETLEEELHGGETSEEAVNLRIYLARALGEFTVPDGLDVLTRAATLERNSEELRVRVAAVAALAVRASHLRKAAGQPVTDAAVVAALIDASRHSVDAPVSSSSGSTSESLFGGESLEEQAKSVARNSSLLRKYAAFALGEVGGAAAQRRLEELLDDIAHPYARYNAATALARRGNPKVVETVLELLQTKEPPESAEDTPEAKSVQRAKLVIYGLRATSDLIDAQTSADLSPIREIIEKLSDDDSPEIRDHAKAVLKKLTTAAAT